MEDELIHQLSAAYSLDALSPEETQAYETHLAHCPACQEELSGFSELAAALAYGAPQAMVPPGLRPRVLAAVRAERPTVVRLRRRRSFPALAVGFAACAAIVVGFLVVTLAGRQGSSTRALRSLPLTGANGSLVVAGNGEATLVVSSLRPAPPGKTYEVWVIARGKPAPAGLFAARRGTDTIHLTRKVPHGATVGVTLERAGGATAPTGTPLVTSAPV